MWNTGKKGCATSTSAYAAACSAAAHNNSRTDSCIVSELQARSTQSDNPLAPRAQIGLLWCAGAGASSDLLRGKVSGMASRACGSK